MRRDRGYTEQLRARIDHGPACGKRICRRACGRRDDDAVALYPYRAVFIALDGKTSDSCARSACNDNVVQSTELVKNVLIDYAHVDHHSFVDRVISADKLREL